MTRMEWQEKLSMQFGQLNTKLIQLGAANRNVFIPDYEDTVPKILDLVLDTHLTEDMGSSYKIVTAVDAERRVAAEIRTAMNSAAIQKTLNKFSELELGCQYDRLVILVLTFDRRVSRDGFDKPFFKPQEDLWNLQTLFEKVSALEDTEKASRISRYLDQMLVVSFEPPVHALPFLPKGAETFVGREPELYTLRHMLRTKKPIFLTGIGGIGKTEVALRTAELYAPPKGAFFIRYDENADKPEYNVIRNVILNAEFSHYQFDGQDNDTRDREYAERLELLRNEYRDTLLIIDNFDLSQKSLQEVFQETEFEDLCSSGANLIFTTRSDILEPEARPLLEEVEIPRLKDHELIYLMRSFMRSTAVEPDDLQKLIDAVDGHTYTVELMARTMARSRGRIGPQIFLDAFKRCELPEEWCTDVDTERGKSSGLKDIYLDVLKKHELPDTRYPAVSAERNGMFERRTLYSHLSEVFRVSKLLDAEQRILRYASLLPVNGLNKMVFRNAVAACEEEDDPEGNSLIDEIRLHTETLINSITVRGWLRLERDVLTIHPVIRYVCRRELKPTDDNCANFLDALWTKYNTKEYDEKNFRQLAYLFEMAAQINEDREGICTLRAGLLWHRLGNAKKALACYEVTVDCQKNSGSNAVDLVRTYNKIGSAYIDLGCQQEALVSFIKAMDMAKNNPAADKAILATTYNNVGEIHSNLGDHQKALEFKLKALRIRQRLYPAEHPHLAASYNNVGSTYLVLEDYAKALYYTLKALDIREKLISSDEDLDLAKSYNNVGGIYVRLREYDKALEYLQMALVIRERVLPPGHPALATSHNNIGCLYLVKGKHAEALAYLLKALEIRNRVLPSKHPDTAETYSNIALAYYGMAQYDQALTHIEQAIAIAKDALMPEHPDHAAYRNIEMQIRAKADEQSAQ